MNSSQSTAAEEGAPATHTSMLTFNASTVINGGTFTYVGTVPDKLQALLDSLKDCIISPAAQNKTTNDHDKPSKTKATSNNTILYEARTPPGAATCLLNSHSSWQKKPMYYVVFRGKSTVVYIGYWDDVRRLTDFVSGSRYKSYTTHQKASDAYWDAKLSNRVECIRNPGDEDFYGPLEDAVQ